MRKYAIWCTIGAFFAVGTLMLFVNAGEIDRQIERILTDYCDPSVAVEFSDVDTCWPGEQISVTINLSNGDSLKFLEIFLDLPAELTLESIDTDGTPWIGTIEVDTVGSDINISFEAPDTCLGISSTPRRLIDMGLRVSPSADFNSALYAGFGQYPEAIFCDTIATCFVDTSGRGSDITIPDDSVVVILDPATVYSYQGYDIRDSCKTEFLGVVPVKLYTNFPCSTYSLAFGGPEDTTLCWEFESKGGGAQFQKLLNVEYYRVYGCPATKPSGDTTIYLGDFRYKIMSFGGEYEDDCSFQLGMYLAFYDYLAGVYTEVYNWGGTNPVQYSDMDLDNGGIFLEPYEVTVDVKDADVGIDSMVYIPVTINPTFWAQDYDLYFEFDTTYLDFQSVISAELPLPESTQAAAETWHDGYLRYRFWWFIQDSVCRYILPDTEQTLFTMIFKAKDAFEAGTTTDIRLGNEGDVSYVHDYFTPRQDTIVIDDYNDSECWTATGGIVTHPVWFYLEPGGATCYTNDKIARIPLLVTYINETCGWKALLYYNWPTYADSVTGVEVAVDSSRDYTGGFGKNPATEVFFGETVAEPCTLAYIWVSEKDVDGMSFGLVDGGWIEYNSGSDTASITPGDSIVIDCGAGGAGGKVEVELPLTYSLEQNYPNPFNASTRISFSLAEPGFANLEIFDVLGRKIKTLLSENLQAGAHSIIWNGRNQAGNPVAGGVYFYVLRSNGFEDSRKMVYLK